MWIIRDKDGTLWLFEEKPVKGAGQWGTFGYVRHIKVDNNQFPEVKWEDEEPTEAEVVIKTKKPTLHELYKDNSLGETIMIDEQ